MKRFWRRLGRAEGGLGAIEFGFIAPVLLMMLLGIVDFGMAFWEQMQITNAADAGAHWGATNAYSATSIQTVARSATNLSGLSASASNPCGCPTSTGVSIYSCSATCPDGSAPQSYVVVNTKMCYSTFFTWPGLSYCSAGSSNCSGCGSHQIALGAQSIVMK